MQFGNVKVTRWISLLSVLSVFVVILSCFVAQADPVTITNDTQFRDTSGNVIHAHGGGMIKVGSTYYWFGECRQSGGYLFDSVKCYSSTDLKTWTFVRNALSRSSASELNTCNIERPKVMYCPNTGQYVMWMHWENGTDYGQARCAVAYSSTVDGPYTYQGSFRPYQNQGVTDHGKSGYMSRDCNVFVDGSTGYFISAANENMDLHLYQLTPDFRNISTLAAKLFVGSQREAPCLFKRGNYYFLLTSAATGWTPNQAKYAYSTSLTSGWSGLANIGNSTTYNSQPAFVIPVSGTSATTYLYLGDHWGDSFGGRPNDSKYTWLPLTFGSNTSMSMSYNAYTTIDTATGVVTLGSGGGTGGWTTVDDNHSSVSYSSGWGSYTANPGYLNTEHYSETTGSVATFTFTGTQARYYGYKRNDLGYAEISVDDVIKASVDCYSSSAIYDTMLYETAVLASGTHTLKIKVAGTKNASSSGTEIICDAFEYTSGSSATPTATLAVTPTPTPIRTATPSRTATPARTATPVATVTPTPISMETPGVTATPPLGTPTPTPNGNIEVQFYNQSTAATTNQVYLNIKLVNTGSSPVALSNVKLRYYYTVDGAKAQTFYCDYTPLGSANVNGTFVTMATALTGADTYVEIGFTSGAGSLAAGAGTTIQARFAKSDWSNYSQTNDYSFNSSGTTYADWAKVTGYVSGALQWGTEP
jgi:hypothetical protein